MVASAMPPVTLSFVTAQSPFWAMTVAKLETVLWTNIALEPVPAKWKLDHVIVTTTMLQANCAKNTTIARMRKAAVTDKASAMPTDFAYASLRIRAHSAILSRTKAPFKSRPHVVFDKSASRSIVLNCGFST